jgi:hypothetical protein
MMKANAVTMVNALVMLAALLMACPTTGRAQASPGVSALSPVAARVACESLTSVDLSDAVHAKVKITSAKSTDNKSGAVCIVQGNIAPQIRFEAHLPERRWTQRYVQTGCGGLCGMLQIRVDHAEQCKPFQNGELATASTDMGHEGFMGDGSFGSDPQQRIDFAYRGVHLTAVAVKALIAKFYWQPARYAYFSGCSDGGREALMEAQRYPDDFDGIAAGAPAMNFLVQNSFYHAWMAASNTDAQGHAILTADKLPILHAAALAQCDALDGLTDGQITDPRACHFDPAVTQCSAGAADTQTCLTAMQVETAKKFYAGPHDDKGHRFVAGSVQPGSELQWRGVFVPETADGKIFSSDIALQSLKNVIFATNPPASMTLKDFHFDEATFRKVAQLHGLYDATNPDIKAFAGRGGKLLLWHGWADPHISPLNTIAYYQAAEHLLGATSMQSMRLFLFPGMGHCGGGDAPTQFDVLTPLMAWVENQHAPEQIVAGRPTNQSSGAPRMMPPRPPGGKPGPGGPMQGPKGAPPGGMMSSLEPQMPQAVNRTRPIYPYPAVARYAGTGDVDAASSFAAAEPATPAPALPTWMGDNFYRPGFQQQCSVVEHAMVCR